MTDAEPKSHADDVLEPLQGSVDAPPAPAAPTTQEGTGFVPFAVIEAERDLPSGSIWMCGMAGGPMRWLRVTLDVTQPTETWPAQVLGAIATRLLAYEGGRAALPFFGTVTGFVVNHAHDHAIRYDRDGNAVEVLTAVRRVPTVLRPNAR
jgi:hypothetical protein